jgi:hypothetical protein
MLRFDFNSNLRGLAIGHLSSAKGNQVSPALFVAEADLARPAD